MQKRSALFTKIAVSLALVFSVTAHAESGVGAFSFDYSFERDRSITPFQVFDDGESTFLQYKDKSKVPTFMVRDSTGTHIVKPQEDGPYLRLDVVAARIELIRDDGKTAAIVSTKRRAERAPQPIQVASDDSNQSATKLPIKIAEAPSIAVALQQRTPAPESVASSEISYSAIPRRSYNVPTSVYNRAAPVQQPIKSASVTQSGYSLASLPPVTTSAPSPARAAPSPERAQLQTQISQLAQMLTTLKAQLDNMEPSAVPQEVMPVRPMNNLYTQPRRAPTTTVQPRTVAQPARIAEANTGQFMRASFVQPQFDPNTANNVVANETMVAQHIEAVPVAYAPTAAVEFQIADGQRLSDAIRRFVAAQNLALDWDTGGADYEIRFGYAVKGATVDTVLLDVLKPFKLNAMTRRGNGVVAVTRAS